MPLPVRGRIAVVVKGYPRLSETFIAQELLGLERAGFELEIVSLRRPTDAATHPVHAEIRAPVSYLPEYLHEAIPRVVRGWWRARRLPGYPAARARFFADLKRDPSRSRVRRFGQALVLAAELDPRITRLHAHFIHTPATVAHYASLLTGLAWSCSAHAKDIWTSPAWELADKLHAARWAVACTRAGHARLQGLAADPGRVHLSYHGLDLERFAPFTDPRPPRDGRGAPVELLAVGRAVDKKGFDRLLEALARLPPGLAWRLRHIGAGERLPALQAQARALGLAERIEWLGAQPQDAVLARYRAADLFVLPCRIAADGDRDGLPNVLVEAASQGLACISTTVSGVPELLADGDTGLLVPPDDAGRLAAALERAITDPALRQRLGRRAQARVVREFSHHACLAGLLRLFGHGGDRRRGTGDGR